MDVPVECTRSDFDWLFGLFVSPFLHLIKSSHDIIKKGWAHINLKIRKVLWRHLALR